MSTDKQSFSRRSRVQIARCLIVAGMAGIGLSACGGSSSSSSTSSAAAHATRPTHLLNTKRVATAIEQSILSERQLHSKVTCPKAVLQQKGHTFTCLAETGARNKRVKTVFTVYQRSDSGKVNYASPK